MQTPAAVVIAAFGIRPLARELEIDPSTVIRWRAGGLIPSRYHVELLELASHMKVKLSADDLIHGRKV